MFYYAYKTIIKGHQYQFIWIKLNELEYIFFNNEVQLDCITYISFITPQSKMLMHLTTIAIILNNSSIFKKTKQCSYDFKHILNE